jgi:NitT/TauT family transport system ATP-binding protein
MNLSQEPIVSENNIFEVKDLKHAYDGEMVLDCINFSFPKGALVAVLGPSGCGKTTLLKCCSGLLRPIIGDININGVHPLEARKSGKIGFAFQSPTLLPWRTSIENILLPLEILGYSKTSENREYAQELLKIVELDDEGDKYPKQLSGGMQQRVGLARALITRPFCLFLDEPFGALDEFTRLSLYVKLRNIWKEQGLTILFVTHSIPEAVFLGDSIILLKGRPAKLIKLLKIDLPEPRDRHTKYSTTFQKYVRAVDQILGV